MYSHFRRVDLSVSAPADTFTSMKDNYLLVINSDCNWDDCRRRLLRVAKDKVEILERRLDERKIKQLISDSMVQLLPMDKCITLEFDGQCYVYIPGPYLKKPIPSVTNQRTHEAI